MKTTWLPIIGSMAFGLSGARALEIQLDYSNDVATDNFFALNPVAKSALEAAADAVSSFIQTTLAAITSDVVFGLNGETSATFNWSLTYTLPSTGGTRTIQSSLMPADTMILFAGVRELAGSEVAQGSPGGMGVSLSGFGYGTEWPGAVADGEQQSREIYRRGGPVIGRAAGTMFLDGTPGTFSVDYGPSLGSLWFDVDTNDDGLADTPGQLASFWHFDHLAPVPEDRLDFYSVAMHEILHTLGIGSSLTWNSLRSGTNWLGPNLIAENGGSGEDLIDPDGKHLASGLLSPRISDGELQTPIMSAAFTFGERRELTEMDAAVLADLNWNIPAPEPTGLMNVLAAGALLLRRRRLGWC